MPPLPLPKKNKHLGGGEWGGVAFEEGRGPGEAAGGTPPGSLSWKTGCFQFLPRALSTSTSLQLGRGMPACFALPFLPSSSPDTLRRPGEKWSCLGLCVDKVPPAVGRSLCGQLSHPPQRSNYLLAFWGVQVVELLLWVLRSGRQSPPAARRPPRSPPSRCCDLRALP